jgi:CheY-specific phosphatase CheX
MAAVILRCCLSQEENAMMEEQPVNQIIIATDDVVRILCRSVQSVLEEIIKNTISISPMVREIENTCLKPDIGCFVLFQGDFSGLIIINFTKDAAMEIYRNYMLGMGMSEDDLARNHTSDEVADSLGELLNQCVGKFRVDLENKTGIFVSHNQPKMLVVTESVQIAIETGIKKQQLRQISFKTVSGNRFYLEIALGEIKFYSLFDFQKTELADIEEILAGERS